MTVVELKEKLISKIKDTDNEELLDQISDLIDFEENTDEIYHMSQDEIDAVNEGLAQLRNGQWISHEDANKEIEEWLKK